MSMQFWGVEVKSKVPSKVEIEFGSVVHLSQATLSDVKKDNEPVVLRIKVDDKDHVLGILSESTPQLSFDLVFETEFEISHNFKNGSVHFLGYQTELPVSDDDMMSDESDESDEEIPGLQQENGLATAAAPKPKLAAKPVKGVPVEDSDEDDSDDDSSDEDMPTPFSSEYTSDSDDDEEDDDDDDESDEDDKPAKAPAKAESGKKRSNADAKTPDSKKAKLVTPQKTDGKKGGAHTATPHPSKKGGKTPGDKSTPKAAGQASCDSCKKSFNSAVALQSHNKAKHSAK